MGNMPRGMLAPTVPGPRLELVADAQLRSATWPAFRNVLVHGSTGVDLGIVRDVVENDLPDLDAFVAAVRRAHP